MTKIDKVIEKSVTAMQRRARAQATLRLLGVEVAEPELAMEARVLDWDEVEARPEILEGTLVERERLVTSRSARARYESFATPMLEREEIGLAPRRAV